MVSSNISLSTIETSPECSESIGTLISFKAKSMEQAGVRTLSVRTVQLIFYEVDIVFVLKYSDSLRVMSACLRSGFGEENETTKD